MAIQINIKGLAETNHILSRRFYKIYPQIPTDIIKSPFTFEFLGLKAKDVVYESDLEQALIDHLEEFILELGHGFCFEAKQKRILIGDKYYFIDLVFYHRVLKCPTLVCNTFRFSPKLFYAKMCEPIIVLQGLGSGLYVNK